MSYLSYNTSFELILKLINDYIDCFSIGVISYSAYILIKHSIYKLKSKKITLYNAFDYIEFKKAKSKTDKKLPELFSNAFMIDKSMLSNNSYVNKKGVTVNNKLGDSNIKYINRNLNQIILHLVSLRKTLETNKDKQVNNNISKLLSFIPD